MASQLPPELAALLGASGQEQVDRAWAAFVAHHSRLLLHAARSLGADYDGAMDRYAFALERLRDNDFQRLRGYVPDGRTRFTTWLVVVARRLALDHYRRRYGRAPGDADQDVSHRRAMRRQLADSVRDPTDPAELARPDQASPDEQLGATHRSESLAGALASLDPGDRLLLKLRFDDGLTAREIAGILGLPTVFHVYRRLNALYPALRRELEIRGVGPDG